MKKTSLTELLSFRSPIEKALEKINPHKALTELAIDCRKDNGIELRHAALTRPYEPSTPSLEFLRGVPCFAALAALNFLNRGHKSLTRPLRDVVKTVGTRAENDEQLQFTRLLDAVKAFTAKRTEVGQFLSSRFDGCKASRGQSIDELVAAMRRETLAPATSVFVAVSKNSDRFVPAGLEALRASIRHEEIQRNLMRG